MKDMKKLKKKKIKYKVIFFIIFRSCSFATTFLLTRGDKIKR